VSLEFGEWIPLSDVLGKVHMGVDLLDTPELIKFSSDDELLEDSKEDL